MNRHHDQEYPATARRWPDDAESLGSVIDGLTNSVVQDIAKSLLRQGGESGLGDSRTLRAAVREVVTRNVRNSQKSKEDAR